MTATACGLPATLYLQQDRVRIVCAGGAHEAVHPRFPLVGRVGYLTGRRAQQLASVQGERKRTGATSSSARPASGRAPDPQGTRTPASGVPTGPEAAPNPGPLVNTDRTESCPVVSPHGRYLNFTSDRSVADKPMEAALSTRE